MKKLLSISTLLLIAAGCARVTVDPIEIKPIHIVQDINIRIDKQLDDFFSYQEKAAATQPAATQPAPTAVNDSRGVTQ